MTEEIPKDTASVNEAAPKTEPMVAPQATIQDFQKLALRVGIVVSAEDHPKADRLLVLKVDVGESVPRQLVAGIKQSYQAADLIGKRVVVIINLKPAVLRGIESQGMILAATDLSSVVLLSPEKPLSAGCIVR